MILVCGGLADPVTEMLCARIEDLDYDYRLLNLGLFPDKYLVDWRWEAQNVEGSIASEQWSIDVRQVSGVFVRYVDCAAHAPMPTVPPNLSPAALAECQAAVVSLLENIPCAVLNRSDPSMSNNSKPYQALLIRECGFKIPETLITNDPSVARSFIAEYNGDVIFKSLSSVRSIVRRLDQRDIERLPLICDCPVQFQRFVPGDNIRVHIVGDELFATRARTEAVDYRYASQQGHALQMEPVILPTNVHQACLRLSKRMGLLFSGIDLKQTPDGEYFCFEVNPAPGFSFYEQNTGQPISTAVVKFLKRG